MKKSKNILDYVEKYKEKYGIKYINSNSPFIKRLGIAAAVVWCYSFLILMISVFSFIINFKSGILIWSKLSDVFIATLCCAVVMVIAAVLFVTDKKISASLTAVVGQAVLVITYMPISPYGAGYSSSFYYKFAVPAILLILIAVIVCVFLIRAKLKTDKLYKYLIEGIYNQYGSKDGEKLSEKEWQEFLDAYNPYKRIE